MTRLDFIETFNRDRYNRRLLVNGENRRAFTENPWLARVRTLALGIEHQHVAMTQSECSRPHGGDQVGVRIKHNNANPPGQPPHESLAKNVARAQRERITKNTPR